MTLDLYLDIRIIVAASVATMGLCLLFGSLPNRLKGTIYDSSRKAMGVATTILPLATFIMFFSQVRYTNYNLYILLLLTAYHMFAVMISITYVPLLGNKIKYKSRKIVSLVISCFVFPIPLLLANIYGSQQTIKTTAIVTALALMVIITSSTIGFFKLYKIAVKRVNNFYSEDLEVKIHWMINSYYYILVMQVICCCSTFFRYIPLWVDLLMMCYRLFVFIYIYRNFTRFVTMILSMPQNSLGIQLEQDKELVEDNGKALSNEVTQHISKHLTDWIDAKNYVKKGLTIQTVATDIYTNRTYLSCYINTTYNYSFRTWITKLRITEAKRLLYYNRDFTIEEVSNVVGFSSVASFSNTFKQIEDITPHKWREMQKGSKAI